MIGDDITNKALLSRHKHLGRQPGKQADRPAQTVGGGANLRKGQLNVMRIALV